MVTNESTTHQSNRQSGQKIHRRETRTQILLPFLFGLVVVLATFLVVALPVDPLWRIRAAAIADLTVTVFCLFPLFLCMFGLYFIVIVSIYGMHKLHDTAQTPLQRLEHLVERITKFIERTDSFIGQRGINWSAKVAHVMSFMTLFDVKPEKTQQGEGSQSEGTHSGSE